MMQLSSGKPKQNPALLPAKLDKTLLAYAAAAGAAGVAMLACAKPAQAEVVYTKVAVRLPIAQGLVQFDINGDGQPDFGLSAFGETHTCTTYAKRSRPELGCPFHDGVAIVPAQPGNEVWSVDSNGNQCAADVPRGARIGSKRDFQGGKDLLGVHTGTSEGTYYCPWAVNRTPNPFLGVKFTDTTGALHYGWIRVTIRGINIAFVNDMAYETTPNQPIYAGEVNGPSHANLNQRENLDTQPREMASLGRLAQGATGLSAWRTRSYKAESYTSAAIG